MAVNQEGDPRAAQGPEKRRLHLRDVESAEAAVAYDGVGADLRAARVRLGKELDDVARVLRIGAVHLQAIEEGQFDDLPGTVYALGFVRSYAEHLGLDGAAVVETFKDETSSYGARTKLVFPFPAPAGRSPGTRLIAVSLLLVAAVFAGWYTIAERERTVVELVPEVPENLQRAAQPATDALSGNEAGPGAVADEASQPFVAAAGEQTVDDAVDRGASATSTAVAGEARDGVGTVNPVAALEGSQVPGENVAATDAETPQTGESGAPGEAITLVAAVSDSPATEDPDARPEAPETPAPSNAAADPGPAVETEVASLEPPSETFETRRSVDYVPQVFGAANTDARIVVIATADSWVQIRGPGDALLLTRVMRRGDRYLVPNRRDLTMLTGNAGALEILVDGTPIAPVGEVGAVRRDISLDADKMLAENPRTP